MKTLSLIEMETIEAGWVGKACGAFAVAAGTYSLGVALNWWNPIGWGGSVLIAAGAIGCGTYALLS